ncbi:MAG: response regulator [Bradymonadia bacterium]|jgi:two-component system invasion response regulator UvrY
MKILICDDHSIVRRGLIEVLKEDDPKGTFIETADGDECILKLARGTFDALILDIGLPGKSGLDVLKEAKQRWPSLPVLVLTVYAEGQYATRAQQFGANAYLTKDATPEEICVALKTVLRGGTHFACAPEPIVQQKPALHEKLSSREAQVLKMLSSGITMGEIASALNLSIKTVSTYRTRILHKLGLQRTGEIIVYGVREGLSDG